MNEQMALNINCADKTITNKPKLIHHKKLQQTSVCEVWSLCFEVQLWKSPWLNGALKKSGCYDDTCLAKPAAVVLYQPSHCLRRQIFVVWPSHHYSGQPGEQQAAMPASAGKNCWCCEFIVFAAKYILSGAGTDPVFTVKLQSFVKQQHNVFCSWILNK